MGTSMAQNKKLSKHDSIQWDSSFNSSQSLSPKLVLPSHQYSEEPQCQQLINKFNHSVNHSMTSSHKPPFIMQSQTDSYLSSDVSSSITIASMTTISDSSFISESYNSVKSTHVEPSSSIGTFASYGKLSYQSSQPPIPSISACPQNNHNNFEYYANPFASSPKAKPDPLSALVGPSMNVKIKTQGAIDDVLDIFTEISADSHDDQKINDRKSYHRMPSRRRPRASSFHHQSQKQKLRQYKFDDVNHKNLPQISSDNSMEISVIGKMPIHPVGHILGDHNHRQRTMSDSWM